MGISDTKRWALVSIGIFVVVNFASYFLRSDFHGIPGAHDGIIRLGWPYVLLERGGFFWHENYSVSATFGNLLVAFAAGAAVLIFWYFIKDLSESSE